MNRDRQRKKLAVTWYLLRSLVPTHRNPTEVKKEQEKEGREGRRKEGSKDPSLRSWQEIVCSRDLWDAQITKRQNF